MGEKLAAEYLKKNSYILWDRNWRCQLGEIDIIASQGKTLSFIEVKTRRQETVEEHAPLMAIDEEKQDRLRNACQYYLENQSLRVKRGLIADIRFEAITVTFILKGIFPLFHVEHHPCIFE